MTEVERNGVFSILNSISNFVNGINSRMECKVFPKEQERLEEQITSALKYMNFYNDNPTLGDDDAKSNS